MSGSDQNDREARLAAKLRENLKRRKDLSRARSKTTSDSSDSNGQDQQSPKATDHKTEKSS